MTTDRYTKAVLTIIAGALLYIGAMLSGQPASAQGRERRRARRGWSWMPGRSRSWSSAGRPRSVRCRSRWSSRSPVTFRGTPDQPLPVAITGIRAGAQWDEIRVKLDPS